MPAPGARSLSDAIRGATGLVSFVQRAVAAIAYEVEPLDAPARLVVQSELVANEPMPATGGDPRAAAEIDSALRPELYIDHEERAVLVHITRQSELRMAAAMDHMVEGPEGTETATESHEDLARVTITADVQPGQRLRVVKLLAYGWSSQALHGSAARPGLRRVGRGAAHRLGRAAGRPARLSRRLLGAWRRRARRRRRASAGGALRALSHPAGGRPQRAARDRRQGTAPAMTDTRSGTQRHSCCPS